MILYSKKFGEHLHIGKEEAEVIRNLMNLYIEKYNTNTKDAEINSVNMKPADELFKDLGYKCKYYIKDNEVSIIGYTTDDEKAEDCPIMFMKKAQRVLACNWLNMAEFSAIVAKCKELGWPINIGNEI